MESDKEKWPQHENVKIDPFLHQALVYHATTEQGINKDEFDDFVLFMKGSPKEEVIMMLFEQIARKEPLQARNIDIRQAGYSKYITAKIVIDDRVEINNGAIKIKKDVLPDAISSAMIGRRFKDLIDHPYIPEELQVCEVNEDQNHWEMIS